MIPQLLFTPYFVLILAYASMLSMRLLFDYVRQYKRYLLFALILATINQGFSLLDPQIFRLLVDNYATKAQELARNDFLNGILLLLLAYIGVALVSRIAKNFQDYYVSIITQKVGARLYAHGVEHSFSLPFAAFEDQRSGELLQKLQKARQDSQVFIQNLVNVIFVALVGIVFVLSYSYFVHWSIGLLYTLLIPSLSVVTFTIGKKIKIAQKRIVVESADLAGSTTETIRNVELVKSLGLESQEVKRLNNVTDKIVELELKKIKLIRILSFLQGTFVNGMRALLMFLMLYLVFSKFITLGEFFTLLFYSFAIFFPLGELGAIAAQYQEARGSMEELEKILNIQREEKPVFPKDVGSLHSISFNDVGFRYGSATEETIQNINIDIRSGETVAFVGPSGSGKSTLVKLVAGLYKPITGKILLNSVNAVEADYELFRKKIGLVSQETQLFAGTIRENLLFVKPDASDEECFLALKAAAAMPIIERGSQGLDTKIGEGGIKLSGGERQRLAIARALLRKPELMIFDEATSSLDSITEKAITETIKDVEKHYPNLMRIIVAHRLSTVIYAQRIYVLERGKIVEVGGHHELLAKNGLYAALWREQSAR